MLFNRQFFRMAWRPDGLRAFVPWGTPFLTTIEVESSPLFGEPWKSVTLDGHDQFGNTTFRLMTVAHADGRCRLFIWEESDEYFAWEAETEEYDNFHDAWRRMRELECYLHQLDLAGLL